MPKCYLTAEQHDTVVRKLNSYHKIKSKQKQNLKKIKLDLTKVYIKHKCNRPKKRANYFIDTRIKQLNKGKCLKTSTHFV